MISEADVVAVLARRGPQHARAIAGFLKSKHGMVSKKDVNSILYAGKDRVFVRSNDERPEWSLIEGRSTAGEGTVESDLGVGTPAPAVSRRERPSGAEKRIRMPAATRLVDNDG